LTNSILDIVFHAEVLTLDVGNPGKSRRLSGSKCGVYVGALERQYNNKEIRKEEKRIYIQEQFV